MYYLSINLHIHFHMKFIQFYILCLRISLLISGEFKWINQLLFSLKSSENRRFSDDLRGNESWLIRLNLLNSKRGIWRQFLIDCELSSRRKNNLFVSEYVIQGVGFHHAGLDVSDRKHMEDMFGRGEIPVMCE